VFREFADERIRPVVAKFSHVAASRSPRAGTMQVLIRPNAAFVANCAGALRGDDPRLQAQRDHHALGRDLKTKPSPRAAPGST